MAAKEEISELKALDESQKHMSGNGPEDEDRRKELRKELWKGKSPAELLDDPSNSIDVLRINRQGLHNFDGYRAALEVEIDNYPHTITAEYDHSKKEVAVGNLLDEYQESYEPEGEIRSREEMIESLDNQYKAEII